MPVIIVGADTPPGTEIVEAIYKPGREVRAFVSDEAISAILRQKGLKVAIGDVSDDSHIEAAATRCFTAVLIALAATDDRERSFASEAHQVLAGWARAVSAAGVTRTIWVTDDEPPLTDVPEIAVVGTGAPDMASRVVDLDDAHKI